MSSIDNSNKSPYQTSTSLASQLNQVSNPEIKAENNWFSDDSGEITSSPITPTPHTSPRKIGFRARPLSDDSPERLGAIKRKLEELQFNPDDTGSEYIKRLKLSNV